MSAPPFRKILIANRGEVVIRIARAAAELGIGSVAVFSRDDAQALHLRKCDERVALQASGVAAYLDGAALVAAAKAQGCDAVHPGYGLLSESADFAEAVRVAGLAFIGPPAAALKLFGDKSAARRLATTLGVPVIEGTSAPMTCDDAHAFFDALRGGAMMIKAVAGGGGRGMRIVRAARELDEAFARCQSEARAAFGDDSLYAERLVEHVRHIEVQVAGDATGRVISFGERECSLQRRNQKIIEIAPSPSLSDGLRRRLADAAMLLARESGLATLGTFEFLVDAEQDDEGASYAFIEANPRLQVEHTVTEEVLGIDLVRLQIELAAGRSLADLGFAGMFAAQPRGHAIQLRINMEIMNADGSVLPGGGTLTSFDMPGGPGVRIDTSGYAGYRTPGSFDSLLAKIIVHSASPAYADAVAKAYRAACETAIAGVDTNLAFLQALLRHPDVIANRVSTRFVETHAAALLEAAGGHPKLFAQVLPQDTPAQRQQDELPAGTIAVEAPLQGTLVGIDVTPGETVRRGQQLAVIEAMKMEHIVVAPGAGIVRGIAAVRGATLMKGERLVLLAPADAGEEETPASGPVDLDAVRPDLAEMIARQAFTRDENRPEAVARRRKTGQRTARENIEALVDGGSFIEYGSLAIAAQRARRSHDDLVRNTPGDGVVTGLATVNGDRFAAEHARCLVVAYDYTVLAGTQGQRNHKKQDRMFRLAEAQRLPVVLFAEGGGGRPGDTERLGVTGLDVPTFAQFAKLSGLVPLVGVVSGRCFAGNAALLGCCDVIIATRDSSIGMGGPAMIEGGGLGVYRSEEVGPSHIQAPNGVIDVLVADETAAADVARRYLSYFQGVQTQWECDDQRLLRRLIPENRLRVYDIREVIDTLADTGSVLELRATFGIGVVTALLRIEGRPFGLIASNPKHLGGAIDAEAGDKAARFIQLCDAFDLPIVSLCDTPGFMVGPEAEKTALVRHVCRMFVTAASVTVPWFTIVLRKGYGLGAQAMAGGGFHAQNFTISWPTGEFGGMGFEGAVRLGYRKEMEAIGDPAERDRFFREMVAKFYETGKAINIASVLEIDQVIDPVETRRWILAGLRSAPPTAPRQTRKRPCIDAW